MAHRFEHIKDNFLRSFFTGTVDDSAIDEFLVNVEPYLSQATGQKPLHFLVDASGEGGWSFNARRRFTKLFEDDRLGRVAIINADRFTRIVATFLMKATGREDSVRFFTAEDEALAWLKK